MAARGSGSTHFVAKDGGPFGAYRNLTPQFIRHRDASRAHSRPLYAENKSKGNDASKLLSAALDSSAKGPDGIDMSQFGAHGIAANNPPAWVQISDEVQQSMARIDERLAELSQYHSKAVLPNFDEFSGEEQQVEVLTKEITRMFKRCEKSLKILQDLSTTDQNDKKVRMNMVRNYAALLQKQSLDFRRRQKDYLSKLKSLQDRGPGGDVFGDQLGVDDEDAQDIGFNEIQIQRTNAIVDMSQDRDQEVIKIIESVNELAQIMKDLAVLVIDQGTILDRIDYNIEQVATSVAEGVKQIQHAEESQKGNKMLIAIACLFVLVAFMVVVVIAKKAIMG